MDDYLRLESKDMPDKIERLIQELKEIKYALQRGAHRKTMRKEAGRLQSAIEALRYVKRKSETKILESDQNLSEGLSFEKFIHSKNNDSSFNRDAIKDFLRGIVPDETK